MFSKSKKSADHPSSSVQTKPSVPSIISTDLKITGDLYSEGEVQIDGTILGDIRSKVLLVGEKAQITGEIIADTLRVHGAVTGQIKAKTVNLAKNAHVVGDILHENLSIEKGAFLEGHITRMEEGMDPFRERTESSPNAASTSSPDGAAAPVPSRAGASSSPPIGAPTVKGTPSTSGLHAASSHTPSSDERVNLVINKPQQGTAAQKTQPVVSGGFAKGNADNPTDNAETPAKTVQR